MRWFTLGLHNVGRGTAKFPGVRIRRSCGLMQDTYGIDGVGNFGLPLLPTENLWLAFQGGANEVIFPDQYVTVAFLRQNSPNSSESYGSVSIEYEISWEGSPIVRDAYVIPGGNRE
jgi:hypothetical protein